MTTEEAVEYIRYCMCEGRLVGKTIPIIDEKWQAGGMAIEALKRTHQKHLKRAIHLDMVWGMNITIGVALLVINF